jgi:hypothetical protein
MVIVPRKIPRRQRRKARERARRLLEQRRRRILNRIENLPGPEREVPLITVSNIHYELGERVQGLEKGGVLLREEYRYFFFITNDRETSTDELVFKANDRCDPENLIAQLKGGVHALTAPVDNLVSNWAYMVMASLAWTLKALAALLLPEEPRHAAEHREQKRSWLRMEFATFRTAVIEMPCQIVRTGRRWIYRLLSWTPWQGAFLRLVERLQGCWLC